MEKKKLQRIIGISVVTALVIVLIPFLFAKKEIPQQEASTPTASNFSETAENNTSATNTDINNADMNNTNTQNTMLPNAEENGITPIAPPVAANTQDATTPAAINPADTQNTSTPNTTNPANATTSSPVTTTPSATPSVTPIAADNSASTENKVEAMPAVTTEPSDTDHPPVTAATVSTPKEIKPAPTHKAITAKKASHFSEKQLANLKKPAWVVQLGSFKDKSNAHRLVNQLRTSGFKAFTHVVTSKAGIVRTRVYIGPEFKQAAAQKLSTQIQQAVKLQGFVIPYKPMAL